MRNLAYVLVVALFLCAVGAASYEQQSVSAVTAAPSTAYCLSPIINETPDSYWQNFLPCYDLNVATGTKVWM